MRKILKISIVFAMLLLIKTTYACTNLLFTKASTTDGSCMITYAADSHQLYGELYWWPAMDWKKGEMLDVYEWDTGKYLGKIPQVLHTYQVIGNMNEHQVSIAETTYGGREELLDNAAIMDYGSLIYIALQRSKNAREAIKVMVELVQQFGYYSSGESFSISDANEVWILEMISKGAQEVTKDKNGKVAKTKYNKGAVWVAVRIPDGYVCGHANQARITTFQMEDLKKSISSKNIDKIFNPEVEIVYAEDVISFAREKGYFKGEDKDFSFSDTYAPLDYGAVRFSEARVWSAFRRMNKEMDKYWSYINGENRVRMPLYIKPDNKISVKDAMELMRDHYEGTPLDMSKDIGAGPYNLPYRPRPMTWKYKPENSNDTLSYLHERAISTQQTGFSFVAQSRNWLPAHIGGILWFGLDDTYSTVYMPIYCGITKVPHPVQVGNGDMLHFTWESSFWVFNAVSNLAYTRYCDLIPHIRKEQAQLENSFITTVPAIDKAALEIYNKDVAKGRDFLTDYSTNQVNMTQETWTNLWQYLFVKYMDWNVKPEKDGQFLYLGNEKNVPDHVKQPKYKWEWYGRIVKDTGEKQRMKKMPNQ